MKSHKTESVSRYILISVSAVVAIISLLVVVNPKPRNSRKQEETKPLTVMPKVISKVKDLEVINTTLKRQGEPSAVVAIEIRNNSDKPIIAIAIESGDEQDASGVSLDGFKGGDEPPSIILPPHGTITMEMEVSNLLPDKPLKVGGVMYADETEDGDELTRKTIRGHKNKAQASSPVKKGGRKQ
jgi:hypothetical protein